MRRVDIRKTVACSFTVVLLLACCATLGLMMTRFSTTLPGGRAPSCFYPGKDFTMRYNEVRCLRDGVNPFYVWKGDVAKPPYHRGGASSEEMRRNPEPINAYAPWEYAYLCPLSFLPIRVAWGVYVALMFACLMVVCALGYAFGKRIRGDRWDGLILAAVPAVAVFYPLWSNFCIGNYSVVVLAAICLMAFCLDRGLRIAAGLCWAVAMVKPNLAILLAVPLLLRRQFVTCAVAALVCLVASLFPVVLCGDSLFTLLAQVPEACASGFYGSAFVPYALIGRLGTQVAVYLGLAFGFLVCVWLTWLVRDRRKWMFVLLPAVICSFSWSYTTSCSYALGYVLFFAIACQLLENPRSRWLWAALLVSLVAAARISTCWHGVLLVFWNDIPPTLRYDWSTYYNVECLCTLVTLVITILLCLDPRKEDSL